MSLRTSRASVVVLPLVLGTLIAVGVLGLATVAREPAGTPEAEPGVVYLHASWPVNFADDRELVGFATHVFLGEVLAKVGTEGLPLSGGSVEPQTQFSVKVLQEIKGRVPEQVVANQYGGISEETGNLNLLEGDALLKPGETAMFSTRRDVATGWYDIVGGPYGAVRAESGQRSAVDSLAARFERADRNQIGDVEMLPFPDDEPAARENEEPE